MSLSKQVCFKIQTEIEMLRDDLADAIEAYIPVGSIVDIKRGGGKQIWKNIEVTHIHRMKEAGDFVGKTTNGKLHHFHWSHVIKIH